MRPGRLASARLLPTPRSSPIMVPDSPAGRGRPAPDEGGVFDSAPAGDADRWTSPPSAPDVTAELAKRRRRNKGFRTASTPRSPVARPVPRTPRCRSWSAGPRRTSPPRGRCWMSVGKTDRARRSVRSRSDGQGRQPAHRRDRTSRRSRRQLIFLEAYGVDTEAALDVLGGGLGRQRRCLNQKRGQHGRAHLRAGVPDRPAPQGHGHRHLSGPRGRAWCCRSARSSPHNWLHRPGANGDGGLDHSCPAQGRRTTFRRFQVSIMRAVDAAVLILEKEGATQLFGLPGAAINPFYKRGPRPRRASSTCWPATSRPPRTWPRATPAPPPATSASASGPRARRART